MNFHAQMDHPFDPQEPQRHLLNDERNKEKAFVIQSGFFEERNEPRWLLILLVDAVFAVLIVVFWLSAEPPLLRKTWDDRVLKEKKRCETECWLSAEPPLMGRDLNNRVLDKTQQDRN